MAGTSISFDGNSLQTANIITSQIDHSSMPQKNMTLLPIAHGNASKLAYVNYPSRTIRIKGTLIGSSIDATDALEDTFKSYFLGNDKNIDIGYNTSTRRYVGSANAVQIDRPGGLSYAEFTVDIACTNPFGMDTSTTTALNQAGRTTTPFTDPYTFLGTAPVQLPVFTYTLTAVTGGTAASVILGNLGTGQQITITRTWSASDVLVVDCVNRTVTVNGVAVAYTGAFPEFAPGAQNITYSDSFTTRTFTINVVYTKMYL